MKRFFITLYCTFLLSVPFGGELLPPALLNSADAAPDNPSTVHDGVTLAEDATWRGTILVKGFVVVPPQTTLRIEPGTVIRFVSHSGQSGGARLIIQGRLQAVGTAAAPIVMTSGRSAAAPGDWGGISLVSTEKRNILEHCRIEYAESGIDVRFSSINLKMVSITRSRTAFRARDALVQMTGCTFEESGTGIEAHDSEFDLRESKVSNCRQGLAMNRSSVGISSVIIRGNALYGLLSEDCRVKISSGEISENGIGARFKGGEGHIQMTRFTKNRETALHLSGSRMKVQRSIFADNIGDAVRLEDGRSLLSGNAFISNKGFNIYNAGVEDANALLNWWGGTDQSAIAAKIHDAATDKRSGALQIFPWLTEKPPLMP